VPIRNPSSDALGDPSLTILIDTLDPPPIFWRMRSTTGWTALHTAAQDGNLEAVRQLLAAGALV
jgi:hypothetical protein